MITTAREDIAALDINTPELLCGEDGCENTATHRAFYVCCMDATLCCVEHTRALQAFINLHGKLMSTCSVHGVRMAMKELLRIEKL